MKQIERFNLLDRIGRELQARMSYSDIAIYLSGFGINCKDFQASANSKWIYVKEILADKGNDLIIQIANDLELEHNFASASVMEATCWKSGHFRLFISHLASFKIQASHLQSFFRKYAISAFVAHEDIEPSKEWQREIESALYTMDAFTALLIPGFKESNWCDQEVGVAVGRDVLIIPVRKGLDPYGFIGKYQAIQGAGKTVSEVAESIFKTIINSAKTRQRMTRALCGVISQSTNIEDATEKLVLLKSIENISVSILEKFQNDIRENEIINDSDEFIKAANEIFEKHGLEPVKSSKALPPAWDDTPF